MDPAIRSMIDNLPASTGRSLDQWYEVLDGAGLDKHGQMVSFLKQEHGVSHGYANGIALQYRSRGLPSSDDDLVDAQYAGPRAALRPVYDALVAAVLPFGDDVVVSPKKTSVSLRRSQQFAVVEPASARRVQLGINLRGVPPTTRLLAAGGMCTHKVSLTSGDDVDPELVTWLRDAYDRA